MLDNPKDEISNTKKSPHSSSQGQEGSGCQSRFSFFDKFVICSLLVFCLLGFALFAVVRTISFDGVRIENLEKYKPIETTIIYDREGRVIGEISKEKRIFTPIDKVPELLKSAIIATEDKTFYTNSGIDFIGLGHAMFKNLVILTKLAKGNKGERFVGASTITQQVVKNVLLTSERTVTRKLREMILSLKITKMLSKEKIFEIYLNHIYFGMQAYGVASAARIYFDKDLEDLSLPEIALLAGLPKAPSVLNPIKNPARALARRNWVLLRMLSEGVITEKAYEDVIKMPLGVKRREDSSFAWAFGEYIKSNLARKGFALDGLQEGGYRIRTTLNREWQEIAQEQLDGGLLSYSKRHGFRGPVAKLEVGSRFEKDWRKLLLLVPRPDKLGKLSLATVIRVIENNDKTPGVVIGLQDGSMGAIDFDEMSWARQFVSANEMRPAPTKPSDVLGVGDVVVVKRYLAKGEKHYSLEQIPEINGAVLIMSPKNGDIFAMVGGYADVPATFNRATQAKRQIGSVIKPFIYLAALEKGIKPTDVFVDGDISFGVGDDEVWKPKNVTNTHLGAVTLRTGIEQSLNTVTIRIAQTVGISKLISFLKNFDLLYNYPRNLSIALGSAETTLMKVATAYATLANGGAKIVPRPILRFVSRSGREALSLDELMDEEFRAENKDVSSLEDFQKEIAEDDKWTNDSDDKDLKSGAQLVSPQSAYQAIQLLKGVVRTGAIARRSQQIKGINFAGKTGTSQEGRDLWFAGFTPEVVIVVYVGFDSPETTGNEYGSTVALPIFVNIMSRIKSSLSNDDFPIPEGVKFVKVRKSTGLKTTDVGSGVFYEVLKENDVVPEEKVKEVEEEDELSVGDGVY